MPALHAFIDTIFILSKNILEFSNAINVKISQYGGQVIRDFADMMAVGDSRPDLNFHGGGYLFLATQEAQAETKHSSLRPRRRATRRRAREEDARAARRST